jgi:hypothetical protein
MSERLPQQSEEDIAEESQAENIVNMLGGARAKLRSAEVIPSGMFEMVDTIKVLREGAMNQDKCEKEIYDIASSIADKIVDKSNRRGHIIIGHDRCRNTIVDFLYPLIIPFFDKAATQETAEQYLRAVENFKRNMLSEEQYEHVMNYWKGGCHDIEKPDQSLIQ